MTANVDLLRQIKKLAEEGATPGERDAAARKLSLLMEKSGISLAEIEASEEEVFISLIRLRNKAEFMLAVQVLGVVTGNSKVHILRLKRRRGISYMATKFQHMEFDFLLPYYLDAFRKQQEDFVSMFITRNQLFPSTPDDEEKDERPSLSPEELERLRELARAAQGLKAVPTPHKQLRG